jgi:hypothetical protein
VNLIKWLFGDLTDKFWKSQRFHPFRGSTPASGRDHTGSNNHNKKSSKMRRLMAKRSRRINRGD